MPPSILDSPGVGGKSDSCALYGSGRTPESVPLATKERQDPDAAVKGGEM